uniref:hypothetical protein n=1 Tax=Bordetella sputigena TaxID=1416810 RepID=UPI0039EF09A3
MFGDQPYGPDEAVVDGLRQPDDPSPEGVSRMMRARWPEQVKPAFNSNDDGFNSLWFEKWYFSWYDETGKSIVF